MTKERKSPEPKLDYEITDIDALKSSLPELVSEETVNRKLYVKGEMISDETTSRKFVAKEDKGKLYRLVKLNHEMNRETPGVTVGKPEAIEQAPAAKASAATTNEKPSKDAE